MDRGTTSLNVILQSALFVLLCFVSSVLNHNQLSFFLSEGCIAAHLDLVISKDTKREEECIVYNSHVLLLLLLLMPSDHRVSSTYTRSRSMYLEHPANTSECSLRTSLDSISARP